MNDMMLDIENPEDSIKRKKKTVRANKWIQQSSKVQNQHIEISCNEQSKKIIKKTTPLTIA